MSTIALRTSGILLIVGAVCVAIVGILLSFNPPTNQRLSPTVSLFLLLSSIALLASLPGMYARQSSASGLIGLAGYLLLQTGIVVTILAASPAFLYPSINEAPANSAVLPVLGLAFILGTLFTSIAVVRAGVFPRSAGFMLLVATILAFFNLAEILPPPARQISNALAPVIIGLAFSWIGISLWSAS